MLCEKKVHTKIWTGDTDHFTVAWRLHVWIRIYLLLIYTF
jgi:hypothetical protein